MFRLNCSSKGGVCLYISVDIDFKPRNVKIYVSKLIESYLLKLLTKMNPMQSLGYYIDTLRWIWMTLRGKIGVIIKEIIS